MVTATAIVITKPNSDDRQRREVAIIIREVPWRRPYEFSLHRRQLRRRVDRSDLFVVGFHLLTGRVSTE